ncbi:MAG: ATP-binding protein [Hydrogenoanaerobacterium sp.]
MYNINIWWHILQFFVFMCPVGYLIFKVFEENLRVNKIFFLAVWATFFVVVSLIIAVMFTEISPYRQFAPVGAFLIIILALISVKLVIKKNSIMLLFILFVFLNAQYNSISLAYATLDLRIIPSFTSYEYGDLLIISSVYIIAAIPALYYLLVKLYKRIVDSNHASQKMNFLFCLPAGFYISVFFLMQTRVESNISATANMLLPLLVIALCEFGSYYASLEAIISEHDAALEREKLYTAKNQLTLWQAQYEKLELKISSEARMRHDWKHHIITVVGFVENKDLDGLSSYLTEYKEKFFSADEPPICDIPPLDMLFQYYKRKAAELNINFFVSTVSFGQCLASPSDLTVLFGNLLENAFDACVKATEGEKYISLKIKRNNTGLITVICENNFDGVINKQDGQLLSRKKTGGIGLSSIEDIAKKYNGKVRLKTENKKFKVYVAFN